MQRPPALSKTITVYQTINSIIANNAPAEFVPDAIGWQMDRSVSFAAVVNTVDPYAIRGIQIKEDPPLTDPESV